MSEFIAYIVGIAICTLLGALWVSFAVSDFKVKRYFRFGFDTMMTVYEVLLLAKLVFC